MQLDQLSEMSPSNISGIISSPLLPWFVFGFFLLFFAVISVILVYHWTRYGSGSKPIAFAEIVYFPVAFVLIGLISFALIMYGTV